MSSVSNQDRFDKLLGALADPYRRELLFALIEHNPQDDDDPDPLDIHAEGEDSLGKMNIFMGHLPQLEDLGIINWDHDKSHITKGPDWEEFEPLLNLIAENKDKLPAEWFPDDK